MDIVNSTTLKLMRQIPSTHRVHEVRAEVRPDGSVLIVATSIVLPEIRDEVLRILGRDTATTQTPTP